MGKIIIFNILFCNKPTPVRIRLPQQVGAVVTADLNDEATQGAVLILVGDAITGHNFGKYELQGNGFVRSHNIPMTIITRECG